MFQTFTGSSRKPRQVNLSGRGTNPWAPTSHASGSPAAIANAQQERERRQQERDRQTAAKTIQRSWRGSASRKLLSQSLRVEYDAIEARRGGSDTSEDAPQLRRLLQFFSARHDDDMQRLETFAARHLDSVQKQRLDPSGGPWPVLYLRLDGAILAALERTCGSQTREPKKLNVYLELLSFLTAHGPDRSAQRATRYYQVINTVSTVYTQAAIQPVAPLVQATTAPLRKLSAHTLESYEAFACCYLTNQAFIAPFYLQSVLPLVAEYVNFKLLGSALSSVVSTPTFHGHPELRDGTSRLSLLSFFIYFHRHAHNFGSAEAYSANPDFVTVVSVLLGSIVEEFDMDEPEEDLLYDQQNNRHKRYISDAFSREQLGSLKDKTSVGSLLGGVENSPMSESPSSKGMEDGARRLAVYALSLLRFFPRSGDEIRMWLFRGSSASSVPAIKYFYQAARNTRVFQSIHDDPRAAIGLLKDSNAASGGVYQLPSQLQSFQSIQDEWKVLLLFFELYSFVLKVMDDSEFFSASGEQGLISASPGESSSLRANALPLDLIKDLTVFLKNLGFTMIFNASEIASPAERSARPVAAGLSSYFRSHAGLDAGPPLAEDEPAVPSVGGISGMSIEYVKGLVTGLMRMIYERDSRRKFLPKDHWLLKNRMLMDGFTTAVVAEEENRRQLETEGTDDVDAEDDFLGPELGLVGEGRARQMRAQMRLEQHQKRASRKRYLQAVAPRLEILQNMPFVIPFETRVQIFRNFVAQDMYKRRHGHVDADMWRNWMMSTDPGGMRIAPYYAQIRRGHEFEDAYDNLDKLKDNIKEPVQISFIDKFGQQEAGIDGGGVTKEFLTSVTQEAFNPTDQEKVKMFLENDHHLLYPNPSALAEMEERLKLAGIRERSTTFKSEVADFLRRFEFLGRIVGKCLYEGILVDVNFAGFFLRKWALTGGEGSAPNESGYRANINDLRDLDEALYQGLVSLLHSYISTCTDCC